MYQTPLVCFSTARLIHSGKPVVEMHRNTSRSKNHETLRLNAQKRAIEGLNQKTEGGRDVKES